MTTAAALRDLDATTAPAPVRPTRILQFGGGNFLRAFVDLMVHQADVAGVMDAGVLVVQATERPSAAFDVLRRQDGRYHVLLEGVRDGEPVRELTRVDVITGTVRAHGEFDAYRAAYLSPALTTIVSNTTEAGIVWVEGDDLAARPPRSFPAKIAALLLDRFAHFAADPAAGLHVLCCELIEDNATTLRAHVLRHATAAGAPAAFAEWLATACSFHDTLVDRIVPGVPESELEVVQAAAGYRDEAVVKGELFGLWAIATGVPGGHGEAIREVLPLDRAGQPVVFLPEVSTFRERKVRILNGLHTALAPVGLLTGRAGVRETVADPVVARYLDRLLTAEVLPSIPGYEDGTATVELTAFAARITERFTNPYLHHRLSDIALNSLAKWQTRNLPVVLDAWGAGREAPLQVLSFAALAVLYGGRGVDAGRVAGSGFQVQDDPALVALVRSTLHPVDLGDLGEVERWLRGVVEAAGLVAGLPGAAHLAGRLAAEAAPVARRILDRGVVPALQEALG